MGNVQTSELDIQLIKDEVVKRIMENDNPYVVKDGEHYDVTAVNLHFTCSYSDDEIKKIASLCLDLLEELRRINEDGYTKEDLNQVKNLKDDDTQLLGNIRIYNSFKTEKIEDIILDLGDVTRVDGAYYMVISKPAFIQGINVVFSFIIDNFENAEAYFSALFMLIRCAMHMHGDEIE